MTLEDLEMIHDELTTNTPGAIDKQNTSFKKWLEEGFQPALSLAQKVSSFEGYRAVIKGYLAGFEDPHIPERG